MLSSSSSRWQARSSSAHWQPSASRHQGSPAQGLRLISVPFLLSLLAATIGRAAAPFITSSPSPLPATSIHQVCPPLRFPSALRDGAPQTLTKLFVFGSESSYNILPAIFDFVCKNYRVYMCTRMSYAGSTPDLRVLGQGRLTVCIFCQMSQWLVLQWQSVWFAPRMMVSLL